MFLKQLYQPMYKLLLLVICLTLSAESFAQTKPAESMNEKDSTEILKDLMDILSDGAKPSGYLSVNLGAGNRIFDLQDNALNSKTTPVNTVIYAPSLQYHHSSGMYVTAGANMLNDRKNGFGASQYSISPGFELPVNDQSELVIAYTHFFVQDIFSAYSSPVHNDLYVAYAYKKTWIKPGIAVDYAGGEYGDVKRLRLLYDSIDSKLKSFSMIPSIAHEFKWEAVFTKNDGIIFNTSLLMNLSKSKLALKHKTNAVNLANFLNKKGRLPKFENTKFQAQSLGLSLDAIYTTGKFSIEPEGYFDYYLPTATGNRLLNYFTVTMRYLLP